MFHAKPIRGQQKSKMGRSWSGLPSREREQILAAEFSTVELNSKSKILARLMENFMPKINKDSHVF